jgi:hypothetical protein
VFTKEDNILAIKHTISGFHELGIAILWCCPGCRWALWPFHLYWVFWGVRGYIRRCRMIFCKQAHDEVFWLTWLSFRRLKTPPPRKRPEQTCVQSLLHGHIQRSLIHSWQQNLHTKVMSKMMCIVPHETKCNCATGTTSMNHYSILTKMMFWNGQYVITYMFLHKRRIPFLVCDSRGSKAFNMWHHEPRI